MVPLGGTKFYRRFALGEIPGTSLLLDTVRLHCIVNVRIYFEMTLVDLAFFLCIFTFHSPLLNFHGTVLDESKVAMANRCG